MTRWEPAPRSLALRSDRVDAWRLVHAAEAVPTCRPLLTPEETARADRFVVERPRIQFTLTRAVLRMLLGRYLDVPARDVTLHVRDDGKPFLPDAEHVSFNVSHTDGMSLLAFTTAGEIGADVERVRDMDYRGVARRFFSEAERAALERHPDAQRGPAFFRCWTRKESYLKAKGTGLRLRLDSFDVSLDESSPALLATRLEPDDAARWRAWHLAVSDEHVGALVAPVAVRELRCLDATHLLAR